MTELPDSNAVCDLCDRALSLRNCDSVAALELAKSAVSAASRGSADPGRSALECRAHAVLASVLLPHGRFSEALDETTRALALVGDANDPEVEALAFKTRAEALAFLDDFDGARAALTRGRAALDHVLEDSSLRWKFILTEGVVHFRTRNFPRAEAAYRESLAMCRAIGERAGEAMCGLNLAGVLAEIGDLRGAVEHVEHCMAVFDELGDRYSRSFSAYNVAVLRFRLGDLEGAATHATEALELAREFGNADLAASAIQVSSQCRLRTDQIEEAVELAADAVERRRSLGGRYQLAVALESLGEAVAANGEPARAAGAFLEAIDLLRDDERLDVRGSCLLGLGESQLALGQAHEAVKSLELAARTCEAPGQEEPLARAHGLLSSVYGDLADAERARRHRAAERAVLERLAAARERAKEA